nr:reverse transcriptase domain-containing protein [Tanacetum cinerariifolium]
MLKSSYKAKDGVIISSPPLVGGVADVVVEIKGTAYETPIGCTPYKLVYEKACHLLIELEHKAYWALQQAKFDLAVVSDHWKVQLNELNELRDHAYENSLIYKEKKRESMTPRSKTAFSTLEMDTEEKDKNKAKNDKTKHGMEKIIRSQQLKVKARGNGYSIKGQKQSPKRQNRTRNGKDRERQSHSKPKVKSQIPRSTKVNPGKIKVNPDKAEVEKAKKIHLRAKIVKALKMYYFQKNVQGLKVQKRESSTPGAKSAKCTK